jgi:hypothetical protein
MSQGVANKYRADYARAEQPDNESTARVVLHFDFGRGGFLPRVFWRRPERHGIVLWWLLECGPLASHFITFNWGNSTKH